MMEVFFLLFRNRKGTCRHRFQISALFTKGGENAASLDGSKPSHMEVKQEAAH